MTSVSYRDFTGTAAENYQRFFVPAIATPASRSFLDACRFRSGERVLDVACGTGLIAHLAARQVGPTGSVTGVDVSPDMIDTARGLSAPDGATIDWHVADAVDLPSTDGTFDVVTCQMGVMFMEDRPAAIAEMRRVLAPGGRLIVSTPGPIQPVFEVMEQAIADQLGADLGGFVRVVFSMHDPQPVASLLTDAGFTAVSSTVEPAPLRLPPPAELLWEYINLTPMAPLVAGTSEAEQSSLEAAMVAGCRSHLERDALAFEQPMVLVTGTR